MATGSPQPARPLISPGKLTDPAWAWAPYQPDAQRPWTLAQAGHLYRRAAFGANGAQFQQALADGPQRTVEKLLRPAGDLAAFDRAFDQYEISTAQSGAAEGLSAWWLRWMIESPHPLREQMTLFWHNHFAVRRARVANDLLMCRHVHLLRRQALGNFKTMLEELVRDPALLINLEARANRKAQPAEFFARVLLEQFTLGSGRFSEKDVKEAARAFTGWFVTQNEAGFKPAEHDAGVKRFLGQEGSLDGAGVVRILLGQADTARLLAGKLYRWLIAETAPAPEALLAPLAADFAQDYDVARLVGTMLGSNLFFSPAAYRQKIKSPVEFALGIIRPLEGAVGTVRLSVDLAGLGQDLDGPPTVQGWAGHRHWINRFTLLGRARLAHALLSSSGPYDGKLDPVAVSRRQAHATAEAAGRFLANLYLQGDPAEEAGQAVAEAVARSQAGSAGDFAAVLRELVTRLVTSPEFQLA